MTYFKLTEIGYDTSIETEQSLIKVAQEHCSSYGDERVSYLPIDNRNKAIAYLTEYGFEVKPATMGG